LVPPAVPAEAPKPSLPGGAQALAGLSATAGRGPSAPQPTSTPRLPPAQPELSVTTTTPKRTSWWRRRRTLVVIAGVIVLFLVLSALNNRDRAGGGATTTGDDYGNTAATGTVISTGTQSGTISPAGDVDWFRLNVSAGANIAAELRLNTLGSGTITILGANGQVLDDATEASGKIARVTYQAREAGSYFIRVRAGRPDATGTYQVVLTTR
jgi:hypothetical protein